MKKISAAPGWLGISDDRSSFVFFEDRADIVKKIFEMSVGGWGSYSIANYLTRQRISPFPPSQNWDHTTIDSMLRNRAAYGEHQPKSYARGNKKGIPIGDPISNYYPAVISKDLFDAAQIARRSHLAVGRGRKGRKITNLFSGITTCDYCGNSVKFHSNGNRKSLICQNVIDGNTCVRAGWSYKSFEDSVLCFLTHPLWLQMLDGGQRSTIEHLATLFREMRVSDAYIARFEITPLLKQVISELRVANAGLNSSPSLPRAIIRRDNPERLFRIRLWNGPAFVGYPVSSSH
jgi:Recombinase